jgi:nitrate reductase delta subunit
MLDISLFDHMAAVLSYPTEHLVGHGEALCRDERLTPEEHQHLHTFCVYARLAKRTEVEELFTQTFDLNPACCLEVGWHLYGEEYERGAFLVNMRQALREEQIMEGLELPDHMSHCLRLLPRLDPDDAVVFARRYLRPALKKILKALDPANPYAGVLCVLETLLARRYGDAEVEKTPADPKIIELPVLNNILHYHNVQDEDGRHG